MADSAAASQRTRLKSVASFVAIAFGFSWIQWFAAIASTTHRLPFHVPLTPLGAFGPAIAAILLLRQKDDRRVWYRSIVKWRVPYATLLTACLALPVLATLCLLLSTVIAAPAISPVFPSIGLVLAATLEIMILGGPLGEEPGWRGFLLPELRKSMPASLASTVVGLIWFLWHLPLFWLPGSAQQQIPMPQFAIALLAYSFILTWLFENSAYSTLVAMAFHTSANVTFWLAATGIKDAAQHGLFWPFYLVALVLLAVGVAFSSRVFKRRAYIAVVPAG